jgi:hypothetical protein
LIYAVIIMMWGAYFIPLWLRRHEERSEARSVDRFSDAMRVLSGRSAETPKKPVSPQVAGSGSAVSATPVRPVVRRNEGARSLALRRRRILAGLLAVSAAAPLLPALTPLPWPWVLLPSGATLGFLVHLRVQARRSRELSRTRSSMRRRALARLRRFDSTDQIVRARRTMGEEQAVAATRPQPAEVAGGWQPVPVPLPTYVTKPVARRAAQAQEAAPEEPFDQIAAAPGAASGTGARAVQRPAEVGQMIERRAVND